MEDDSFNKVAGCFSIIGTIITIIVSYNVIIASLNFDKEKYPQDISGYYTVRKITGTTNNKNSVEILNIQNGYELNVYSTGFTRRYHIYYNPSSGIITSNELGEGKARIIRLTNEIEITFEGWEIIK